VILSPDRTETPPAMRRKVITMKEQLHVRKIEKEAAGKVARACWNFEGGEWEWLEAGGVENGLSSKTTSAESLGEPVIFDKMEIMVSSN